MVEDRHRNSVQNLHLIFTFYLEYEIDFVDSAKGFRRKVEKSNFIMHGALSHWRGLRTNMRTRVHRLTDCLTIIKTFLSEKGGKRWDQQRNGELGSPIKVW